MKDREDHRIELLPDADPEAVRAALHPPAEPVTLPEIDPDDPEAVWLLGDDPEARVMRIADRRSLVRKQVRKEGFQFVVGLFVLAVSLGVVALAVTIRTMPFVIAAAVVFPAGAWYFRSRWRRWLGAAPYMYRLMTSLGEDAENILVEHEEKKRRRYVKKIGDLYEHTRPKAS